MSTTIIPAKTIVTCDCCAAECNQQNRREMGELNLRQHGLDMAGHAVADASIHLDLCDRCLGALRAVVNATAEGIRKHSATKESAAGRPPASPHQENQ